MRSLALFAICLPILAAEDFLGAEFKRPTAPKPERTAMYSVWDVAGHASNPDLIRYDNRWLIAFREASTGASNDGAIRVVASQDGQKWLTAARIEHAVADLSQPRLHQMPNGQLLLTAAVTMHADGPSRFRTYAWKSWNGREWEGPERIGDEGVHLGALAWSRGKIYTFGYEPGVKQRTLRGYMAEVGLELSPSSPASSASAHLGRTSLAFLGDDSAAAVAEHADGTLHFALSPPPYRNWQWRASGQKVADPRLMKLSDGRLMVSGADMRGRTSLYWLNPAEASVEQITALSSESTNEGSAMLWFDSALWTAYRATSPSGHAGIYIARIKLP